MGLTKANFKVGAKPKIEICTSWDDGRHSDIQIVNLLKKYSLPGTFYIVVDWVGQEGFMTWDDIKWLEKQGFRIGSHTVTHPQDLKMVFDEQLHYEVQNSKDMIETVLGHEIDSFCYPRGRADERVRRYVVGAGYKEARGTGKPGVIKVEDQFYLPGTIHIYQREEYGDKSILSFAKETLDRLSKEGGYCNIWGHSPEIEIEGNWKVLEEILAYAKQIYG